MLEINTAVCELPCPAHTSPTAKVPQMPKIEVGVWLREHAPQRRHLHRAGQDVGPLGRLASDFEPTTANTTRLASDHYPIAPGSPGKSPRHKAPGESPPGARDS